jgi:hypothetical protein
MRGNPYKALYDLRVTCTFCFVFGRYLVGFWTVILTRGNPCNALYDIAIRQVAYKPKFYFVFGMHRLQCNPLYVLPRRGHNCISTSLSMMSIRNLL